MAVKDLAWIEVAPGRKRLVPRRSAGVQIKRRVDPWKNMEMESLSVHPSQADEVNKTASELGIDIKADRNGVVRAGSRTARRQWCEHLSRLHGQKIVDFEAGYKDPQ